MMGLEDNVRGARRSGSNMGEISREDDGEVGCSSRLLDGGSEVRQTGGGGSSRRVVNERIRICARNMYESPYKGEAGIRITHNKFN